MSNHSRKRGLPMIKKILIFALLCLFALSACKGKNSSSYDDDCEENASNCQTIDDGSNDVVTE